MANVPVENTQAIDFVYKSRVWAGAIEVDKKVVVSQTESATDGIQHHIREWRRSVLVRRPVSCPTIVRLVHPPSICQSWLDPICYHLLVLVLNLNSLEDTIGLRISVVT